MRALVDRASLDEAVSTFAPEQIGRTQYLTPKGFLYCEGVRIARTGPMLYAHDEVPEVTPAPNGAMTCVVRDAETLFAPETIKSFAGMDVTNDHPDHLLTPESPRKLAVGTVLNPRQGEGVDNQYLVADLLIKDAQTIKDVQAKKKREVSCGYDADVEEIKPGLGRQTKMIGNHVAIVERGRAGPTCAIQDSQPSKEGSMPNKRKSFLDRIRKAFKDGDEGELNKALLETPEMTDDDADGDGPDGAVHVHIHQGEGAAKPEEPKVDEDPYEARFKSIEDSVAGLCSKFDEFTARAERTGEESRGEETTDEAEEAKEEEKEPSKEETMDAIAKAEKILPGYKAPTMDSAKRRTLTDMRRDVLTRAFADAARQKSVIAVAGGRTEFSKVRPRELRTLFDAAAAVAHANNNTGHQRPADVPQGAMTASKLQALILERRKAS